MAPFLGKAILGEEVKTWDIIGILCGFSGMLMLVHPFDTLRENADDQIASSETDSS